MASIVVIDSEPLVRSILTRILSRGGHLVRATSEIQEAIALLRVEMADIVLTDVYLRGIAGHHAIKQLRTGFPNIRVLMVSGLPDEDAIAEWRGEPRFDIFPKPFDPDALLVKVRQFLASTG